MSTPKTDHRKKLLLIIALFFIPLMIATAWYALLPKDYSPSSTTNNGNLIQPAYSLQNFSQQTLDGKTYTGKDLETIWTLVYLLDRPCDEACSKVLYNTRQTRIALNKDIDRLKRIAVVTPEALANTDARMWKSHPDLTILTIEGADNALDVQIRKHTANLQHSVDSVYLVDPLGNLMMEFSPELNPKLMLKDIRKLLRLSHIG